MPRKCFIPGCGSNSGKFKAYTPVFSFPKNESRRAKWINIVKVLFKSGTFTDPGINACICIHHFDPKLVEKQPSLGSSKLKLRLKKEAVPSILKPNRESTDKTRKIIRRLKQKHALTAIKKQKPPKSLSPESEDEIIRKIKEEQIRISTSLEYLEHYGPQYYKTNWNQHNRVLQQLPTGEKNPLKWTVDEVAENIQKICTNEEISSHFKEQEIDGGALLDLSKEDLTNLLNIKLGPSIKIFHFIEKLRNDICEKYVVVHNEIKELEHLKT